MNWLLWLAVASAGFCVFVVWFMPWLRKQTWAKGFFDFIEPVEIALYKKSDTILFARFNQVLGGMLSLIGVFGGIDYTMFALFIDAQYHPFLPLIPVGLNFLGTMIEAMRNRTTKPLELVAIPESAPFEVKIAAAVAHSAKVEAVAAVKAEEVKVEAGPPPKRTE